jgi:hypothetical protein
VEFKPKLLSLRFQDATGCTEAKADRLTHQYLNLCVIQIVKHLNKDAGERVYVSLSDIQNRLGDITVRGQRFYAFKTFQSFPERILVPIQIGTNLTEELTMAELNYKLEELLIAQGDAAELFQELYKEFNDLPDEDIDFIPIDQFSLDSFIKGNLNQDRTDPAHAKRVNNYLYHALRIQLIARAANGQMPHVINESQFGRKYYRGPNLQNTPKIVRLAALGTCYEYDVESSVFAWKYSWFTDICRSQNDQVPMPATLEYLDHKSALRRRLARAVFDSTEDGYVNIIKEAITAIGFGAPARTSGYVVNGTYEPTALSTIIRAKTRLQRFLDDAWVKEFIAEQRSINTVIVEYARLQGMEAHFRTIPELVDRGDKLRVNSVVSYLYQQTERKILDFLTQHCADREILLTVHDCIYTRRAINMLETREGLRQFGEYFDVSVEHHSGFAYDDEQEEHRQRMEELEQLAEQRALAAGRKYSRPGRKFIPQGQESIKEGAAYTGAGHTGTEYDPELDPFFMEEE